MDGPVIKSGSPQIEVQAQPVVVNRAQAHDYASLDLVYQQEAAKRQQARSNLLLNALERAGQLHAEIAQRRELVANIGATDLIRTEFLKFLLDGPRDIDADCGYPAWLTPAHYRAMYDREGVAQRVVECEPKETWSLDPVIYETKRAGEANIPDTPFEKEWNALLEKFNFWHYLQRVDILSGIGQYGILLLGIDDGKDLHEPVDGFDDYGNVEAGNKYKLMYLRPFDESVTFVKIRETDVNNPRYGLPKIYTIQFRDFPNWGIQAGEIIARDIHWTRIIHVADNCRMSEIYGIPRMQQVWNRLYDLRKIYSSSGEAFWKGGFPGLALELDPEVAAQGNIAFDDAAKKETKEELQRYQMGLQRYIALVGLKVQTLQPAITDPTSTVDCHLQAIAIAKDIPYRILFGSEEARLAGDQDAEKWIKHLNERQTKYVGPMLIRRFVDRLIDFGCLPKPSQYKIDWPDLHSPSDLDRAQVGLVRAQGMAHYVQSGAAGLIPAKFFLGDAGLGLEPDLVEAIMDAAEEQANEETSAPLGAAGEQEQTEQQGEQDKGQGNEGNLGGYTAPATMQNALLPIDLGRTTTVPDRTKGKRGKKNPPKAQDATFVQMPDLNSAKKGRSANGAGSSRGRKGLGSRKG